jgi:hypothetical protein
VGLLAVDVITRLYQKDDGLYEAKEAPVGGRVDVYSIASNRTFRIWEKSRRSSSSSGAARGLCTAVLRE